MRNFYRKQLSLLGTKMGSPLDFEAMLRFVETRKVAPAIDRILPLRRGQTATKVAAPQSLISTSSVHFSHHSSRRIDMFKHISAINRNAGTSLEEFREYWEKTHSQIVKTRLPKLRKYVANFPVRDANWPGSGQHLECDALVELHFDSMQDLLNAMEGPGWNSAERRASSAKCMELGRNHFVVGEEVEVELLGKMD